MKTTRHLHLVKILINELTQTNSSRVPVYFLTFIEYEEDSLTCVFVFLQLLPPFSVQKVTATQTHLHLIKTSLINYFNRFNSKRKFIFRKR